MRRYAVRWMTWHLWRLQGFRVLVCWWCGNGYAGCVWLGNETPFLMRLREMYLANADWPRAAEVTSLMAAHDERQYGAARGHGGGSAP